ncbi:restriction endonuclease subunit S [Mycolicibacter algericus]|uniref:Uncharacterized protein n=2 Tax=Mycolicibacter algericus TaxID=1288388 RepID=A0A7I9YAM4_MYCAL|nr:restriction endonuclease subunit S [Mycolicibacter algericus]GFG85748.1 hypothetical protein MALGJ_24240 [Mycolicibacter algericus]
MFHDLPRYGAYTPAGDWLAEVPAGWSWKPARTIFSERKEPGFVDEQMLSVTIGRGVIRQADLLSSTAKKDSSNLDKSKYKLVEPGDVVYNKMRAWQGAAGGSAYRGIVSPAYIVMTPRSDLTDYFHHIVRTPMFAKEAERWSYGITSDQWSLRPEHFKMIRFPVPPADEQAAIVKYLSHANARIDKAITAKRRLIALLEEQIRTQADVAISDLPTGTAEPLLGRALRRIEQGMSPTAVEGDLAKNQWAVLSLSAVNRGTFVADALKPVDPDLAVPAGLELRDGDLLMTRSNTRDRVGDVAVVSGVRPRTFMSDLIYRLVPLEDFLSPEYASVLLRTRRVRSQIESSARGSSDTMPKLAQAHIKGLRVPVPTLDVQRGVVDALARQAKPILMAADRAGCEVSLLQEFRRRLVADVVTGQVDVRAIAATLPAAPEAVADLAADSDDELEEVAEDCDD